MSEAAVSYAAIILADADVEITSDKLLTLVQAAGIEDVEPIWAQLYAKAIAGQDLPSLLTQFSAGASAGPAVAGGAAAAGASAAAEEEEEKVEEKEESDEDMGMGLFD